MHELPNKYPSLYDLFQNGYYTVRRCDQYWFSLRTNLIIEQSLMRSLKKRGGLTRGRGMREAVRLLWIYSSHKCAEIHQAMTDVLNSKHGTSDQ